MKVQFDKITPAKEMVEKLYEKEFDVEFPTQCYHENNLYEATGCNDLTKIIDEIKKLHSLEQVVIVSRFFKNMTLVACCEVILPGNDDLKREVARQIEVVAVEKLKRNLK